MKRIFDWKSHPEGVFLTAIPLVVVGLGSLFYMAVAKIYFENDWGYLIIFAVFVTLGVVALTPAYRLWKSMQ